MATVSGDPTLQRRRLRFALREMRLESGKTQRDIAEAMEWSLAKTIRIESGEVAISVNDLKALLGHLGETDERRIESLVEMARASRDLAFSDLKDLFTAADLTYMRLEGSASIIRSYQDFLVPGLLQTGDYARASLVDAFGFSDTKVGRVWQARHRRQAMHERVDPPEMFFVLDEAVVRRVVGGPAVMGRQLEKLKGWSQLGHVTIQVMPFDAGAYLDTPGPFILLEFADPKDDHLLYQEHITDSSLTREGPEVTDRYLERFFELEQRALSPGETIEMLDELIARMNGGSAKELNGNPERRDL